MSILKGFAEITSLIDNDSETVSIIGELSANSKTFVRDYTTYTHTSYPDVLYLNMQALDDELVETEVSSGQSQAMLEVITWIHGKARTGDIGPSSISFRTLFTTEFGGRYTLLSSGDHVLDGTFWYPGSISFCISGNESIDNWTIWFSDNVFSSEFDVSILLVVPPIDNVDLFFNTATTVEAAVNAVSREDIMEKVYIKRDKYPYTVLRMIPFNWTDPNNATTTVETYWTIVIYGAAGNNVDSIKAAIVEYLTGISSHTSEEWSEIFPDIFKSTEVILTPSFFIQGVEDQQFSTGMYSGISSFKDSLELAKLTSKGTNYNDTHIADKLTNIPSLYRGVSITLVPGPDNRDGYQNFRDIYWDYLNVTTSSIDFSKMREMTRNFIVVLTDMLEKAEELTPSTVVPPGYNRVERDGIWYLTKSMDDLLILVVTKYSVLLAAESLSLPTDQTTVIE